MSGQEDTLEERTENSYVQVQFVTRSNLMEARLLTYYKIMMSFYTITRMMWTWMILRTEI